MNATKPVLLVCGVVAGAVLGVLGLALGAEPLALIGLLVAVAAAGALAALLLLRESRREDETSEEMERLSAEHARLSDQLITAEQEERRRLALFLHDGPVQSLSGIALMLDAAIGSVENEKAQEIMRSALDKQRETIRSLRDLSFELEPVVLRDQGFTPAVRALAEQLGMAARIEIELDVEGAETLAQRAQVAIYQIIREALHQAIRRGPPAKISVRVGEAADGVETVIADDAPGERRRRTFEAIEERARSLGGVLYVDQGEDGGTAVRVVFPTYAVRR
ncbi:MAG: sensor histidine kinase [Gaiellaceae bacterium]